MIATPAAPQVTPAEGEAYEDFVVRAHRELFAAIPEPMDRNRAVWQAWSAVHGDIEQDRADRFFASEFFFKRPDVCYFTEHEATGQSADGKPVIRRYDVGKLAEIMRENNSRIEDVDAYPTLTDGHTAPRREGELSPQPKTIGGIGPFRLGMVGRKDPRFALFANEYGNKEDAATIKSRPHRSVEVLTLRANGRTYINPVAALSQAPRLPLPVQFAAHDGDAVVERYQAVSPYSALPGGGNTFLDKFGADGGENSPEQDSQTMIGDDDVRKLMDAMMAVLPQMIDQAITAKMGGKAPGGDGAPTAPTAPNHPAQPASHSPYNAGDEPRRYSADEVDKLEFTELQERYSALAADHAKLAQGHRVLIEEFDNRTARLEAVERDRCDTHRLNKLQGLANKYPHGIDLSREEARCLYSAGSQMDDETFTQHVEDLEYYAARAMPQSSILPRGEMPNQFRQVSDVEAARYAAEEAAEVRKLTNQFANEGKEVPYPELVAQARKNLGRDA